MDTDDNESTRVDTDDNESRRVRVLHVDPLWLLRSCNNTPAQPYQTLTVPAFDLPEGFKVVGCNYQPEWVAFAVMVQHPSFDVVPMGHMVPRHETYCRTVPVMDLVGLTVEH